MNQLERSFKWVRGSRTSKSVSDIIFITLYTTSYDESHRSLNLTNSFQVIGWRSRLVSLVPNRLVRCAWVVSRPLCAFHRASWPSKLIFHTLNLPRPIQRLPWDCLLLHSTFPWSSHPLSRSPCLLAPQASSLDFIRGRIPARTSCCLPGWYRASGCQAGWPCPDLWSWPHWSRHPPCLSSGRGITHCHHRSLWWPTQLCQKPRPVRSDRQSRANNELQRGGRSSHRGDGYETCYCNGMQWFRIIHQCSSLCELRSIAWVSEVDRLLMNVLMRYRAWSLAVKYLWSGLVKMNSLIPSFTWVPMRLISSSSEYLVQSLNRKR